METIVLDPSEVATNRTQFDLTSWIAAEGIDWGEAAMVPFQADSRVGASPVDFRIENRTVTIPLSLRAMGGTTFATARTSIQRKIGEWQRSGGWIKRVLSSGGTVYADVVSAQLRLGGDWLQAHRDIDINAEISCEVLPDFYGTERTLSDHVETSAAEIRFTETNIAGDFPLGNRVRLVVDNDSVSNQKGLIWGFRARHYSSASTAAQAYEAEALDPLGTTGALAGASGGQVATKSVTTSWTAALGTNIGGATWLTHTGTNRVFARVYSTAGTAVRAKLVWNTGDLVYPVENAAVSLYDPSALHIIDLGEVRLDPVPTGPHRWQGEIAFQTTTGTANVSIDRIWIINADEGFGILRGTQPNDAVAFAGNAVELGTERIIREDSTGAVFVPVATVLGDLPRLPNRSSAGTVETFVKMSRGDIQSLSDPGIDDLSAQIMYRPCWLTTPE